MEIPELKGKYTQEEKKQLLANLDIEVEHRVRQFEAWLADELENFKIHQEGQILRVPKLVRNLTMREFGEKYNGDMQAALKGIQKERMGGADAVAEIDKTTRKRKWVASQEAEAAADPRPVSPTKLFPTVTSKTGTARAPKRHESMLSMNGSPIANPYGLGVEWFAEGGGHDDDEEQEIIREDGRRKRANSIIVRRDPSFSLQAAPFPNGKGLHSRAKSQSNLLSSQSATSSQHPQPKHHPKTPRAPPHLGNWGFGTALITIPTKDGHLLEFDPLQTSPGAFDALEGISDSAKKHAKEDMGRLVQGALSKWKI